MTFTLSDQQDTKVSYITKYTTALEDIKRTYLKKLEDDKLQDNERENIWDAILTLQYMLKLYEKYQSILSDLQKLDAQSQAILTNLLENIKANPSENLESFINEFNNQINSEDFKNKLKNTNSHYIQWSLINTIMSLVAAIATIVIGVSLALILPPLAILILPINMIGGTFAVLIRKVAEDFEVKSNVIKTILQDLFIENENDNKKSFECVGEHHYEIIIREGETKTIHFKKNKVYESPEKLRHAFFKNNNNSLSQDSLSQEVINNVLSK
jgi:hypothetical protein